MEVSGLFHAWPLYFLRKLLQYTLERRLGRPQNLSEYGREEKYFVLLGI
jgi:hypothetical protein